MTPLLQDVNAGHAFYHAIVSLETGPHNVVATFSGLLLVLTAFSSPIFRHSFSQALQSAKGSYKQ